MLAAVHRLRRRADFAATIRGGPRAAPRALVVHLFVPRPADLKPAPEARARPGVSGARASLVAPVASLPTLLDPDGAGAGAVQPPRAGFVVSRAVGGAVTRNRVKRRLRHLVRERIDDLPDGAMLVVRALPTAADRQYAELRSDLDGALARATTGRRR